MARGLKLGLESRGIVLSLKLNKTKVLIGCMVTTEVICAFVFTYAGFAHVVAQITDLFLMLHLIGFGLLEFLVTLL